MDLRNTISALCLLTSAALVGCAPGTGIAAGENADGQSDAIVDQGATHTLWIHGRNPSSSTRIGDYTDFSYWGPSDVEAGVGKMAVNWDGKSRIAESNGDIRRALDCFCTGKNWCYVVVHSAGDAQIGYALSMFGDTFREVQDGVPDSSGACGGTGDKQVGWNISWVDVAAGAAGGSELSDIGSWAVSDPLTSDLRTGTMRSLYDHNETQGVSLYMFAGAKGTVYSAVLPGQDDEAVAYHSAGGLSDTGSFCNPGDHFCDGTLEYNGDPSKKDGKLVPKWANHSVYFRDDAEKFTHFAKDDWQGIISVARADVADYAK